jgi:N-carbamoylputrescine amidase
MDATYDSAPHWQRVMQGHAGANLVPVIAANRIGTEIGSRFTLTFYGSSFIAGPTGEKVAEADRSSETVLTATFDLDEVAHLRSGWGVFRDRRTDLN